jgi:beta-glucosidase
MAERVGEAITQEVRGVGGNFFIGMCINLPHNSGWGKSQEVYSENSIFMGEKVSSKVYGTQNHKVIAYIK